MTKFAPHKALKLITWGKLTFDPQAPVASPGGAVWKHTEEPAIRLKVGDRKILDSSDSSEGPTIFIFFLLYSRYRSLKVLEP